MAKGDEAQDSVVVSTTQPQALTLSRDDEDKLLKDIRQFKDIQANYLMATVPDLWLEYEKEKKLQPKLLERDFVDAKPQLIDEYLKKQKDQELLDKLEEFKQAEQRFYKEIHAKYGFQPINWAENDKGQRVAKFEINGTTVELSEVRKEFTNEKGEKVQVRHVDLKTEGMPGKCTISLALLDKDGHRPPADKGVYFTINYDEHGKLAEVVMPQPVKFVGNSIITEVDGKEYSFPVDKEKLEELQKYIASRKGLSFEAPDRAQGQGQEAEQGAAGQAVQQGPAPTLVGSMLKKTELEAAAAGSQGPKGIAEQAAEVALAGSSTRQDAVDALDKKLAKKASQRPEVEVVTGSVKEMIASFDAYSQKHPGEKGASPAGPLTPPTTPVQSKGEGGRGVG
jgi:hypothetical protein